MTDHADPRDDQILTPASLLERLRTAASKLPDEQRPAGAPEVS